ncbi:MAG: ABC-F family ATP-binding cassette domain-containing protein [Calditrichia bacterium]
MLSVQELSYSIGDRYLLKDVSVTIPQNRRIGLIGPNGTGKTTFFRLLVGELQPESGSINHPRDFQIGYLPQEESVSGKGSILAFTLSGNSEICDLETQIFQLHEKLARENSPKLLEELGRLESHYQLLGGYELEGKAKKILSGLGFRDSEMHRPLSELSGGWRMRVHLARILLQEPDLLLLDEPTNHLDIPSLEWLESYLRNYPGSILLISHDRFFLDRLVDRIWELSNGRLENYEGNYRQYESEKAARLEQIRQQWEKQQREIAHQKRFIERFRYKATKAAQVQSRIKQLEKMEVIELPEEDFYPEISFSIKVHQPSFKEVFRLRDVWFRYTDEWIFENLEADIFRGEKIALIGPNGIGKTTFTRLLAGELSPQKGSIIRGQRVQIGYYAQHQIERLNPQATVFDEVSKTAATSNIQEIRDVLGIFRFHGDDVLKKIAVLSGGERARVSLAKILLSPVNFLIMDEPTNHLDLKAKESLEKALQEYDGTLLLISHDRYFLNKLVTKTIEIRDRKFKILEGNYSAYLERKAREAALEQEIREESKPETSGTSRNIKTKEQKRKEAEARQAISKQRKKLSSELEKLEAQIANTEERIQRIEHELADPAIYQDAARMAELNREYKTLKETLPSLYEEWEKKGEELQELLASLET